MYGGKQFASVLVDAYMKGKSGRPEDILKD